MYIIYFCILSFNNFCKCVDSQLFPCSFMWSWNKEWIKQKQVYFQVHISGRIYQPL
ncbi:hypothetical protein V6Z12_D06G240900 [Gossypium hirsutum]